jgi:DNA polymerase III epsilon subunit-like protein
MDYFSNNEYDVDKNKKKIFFFEFIKGATIVSHNINFDIDFKNKEFGCNINKRDCLCTMQISKNIFEYYNLESLAYFYQISVDKKHYHNGIVDATVLARIVCKMNENCDVYYNIKKYFDHYLRMNQTQICEKKKIIQNKNIKADNNIKVIEDKIKKFKEINETNKINFKKDEANIRFNIFKLEDINKKESETKNKAYITPSGKCYHLIKDCASIKNHNFEEVTVEKSLKLNKVLCKICKKFFNNKEYKI